MDWQQRWAAMICDVDDQFRSEALVFCLRFACGSCAWFDNEQRLCSHGYPNEDHMEDDPRLMLRVVFCKEFELA
ncbi:MAG: hypothetical protein FWD57_05080 [Polyangiaceae bacterium]|nr:hypothetical protein [Polyangiaceae bacterium]